MTPNELRIGNLVHDHLSRILRVSGIKDEYIYCDLSNGGKVKYHINTFKPIKITDSRLLNLGFQQCENEYWFQKGIFSIDTIGIINIQGRKYSEAILNADIKHIHQLQNAYFSLIGEELTLQP